MHMERKHSNNETYFDSHPDYTKVTMDQIFSTVFQLYLLLFI